MFMNGQNALPIVNLQIWPNGSGSGRPYIDLGGIKMDKISVTHRPGSNLMMETWTFIGTGSVDNSTAS